MGGIVQVCPKFQQNLVWRLGKGQNVKMWTDNWLPEIHTLGDFALEELDEETFSQNVADFANENGDWDWDKLENKLPRDCLDVFLLIKAPCESAVLIV